MGFEGLLGNERLKENLSVSVSRGRVSHFYLISGAEGSGKRTLAQLLAAAALCQGDNKPCLQCSHCRKVMAGTHPDFITVDDPDKKHVPVELIRSVSADLYIQPNEADRKIYLFPRAQDMLPPSQNALLKILEEPPAYGLFLLLTDNPQILLPTVRSRCTELALNPLPDSQLRPILQSRFPQAGPEQLSGAIGRSGGYLGQAIRLLENSENLSQTTLSLLESYARSDALGIATVLVPMEKWKREDLIRELEQWLLALTNALTSRSGIPAVEPMADTIRRSRTAEELIQGISALQKALDYAQRNVSTGAICGYLSWALR